MVITFAPAVSVRLYAPTDSLTVVVPFLTTIVAFGIVGGHGQGRNVVVRSLYVSNGRTIGVNILVKPTEVDRNGFLVLQSNAGQPRIDIISNTNDRSHRTNSGDVHNFEGCSV